MKKTGLAILIAFAFAQNIFSQEFIGLRTGNYSGSNGMLLNPASPLSGNLPWDINIAAIGIFADNNYVYAPHSTVLSLANNSNTQLAYHNVNRINARENILVQAPSGFLKIGDFAFGLFTTVRSAGYVASGRFPGGANSLQNVSLGIATTIPASDAGILSWMEIGVNGEMALNENINVGVNLKYLGGFDGLNFHNDDAFTFTKAEQTTDISNMNVNYAYTSNLGSNKIDNISNYKINGWGLGTDVGITYTIDEGRAYRNDDANYNWKLGASLVDVGFIHFRKNAGTYTLNSGNVFTVSNADIDSISDIDEFTRTASRVLYDNSQASQTGSDFYTFLPAAITVQADKNLGAGFFVNGLIVRRISFINQNIIGRSNIIAVSPRYEKRWLGVTVPFVLYEDTQLHVGTAVRILFFTIGSDNILSWIAPGNLSGTDIYAGIKINPFNLSSGNGNTKYMRKSKSARMIDCPKVLK